MTGDSALPPYIAFEGIEGAGKSTVIAAVAERLESAGVPLLCIREPGGTVTGERIRDAVLRLDGDVAPWAEALLFAASRAQLVTEVVAPARRRGTWVLTDRSVYSSLAYQGGGRQLGIASVREVNAPGLGEQWPDLVVYLRIEPELGLSRQDEIDRIGGEGAQFQARVSHAFDSLAAAEPDLFAVIDAGLPVEAVVDAVWSELTTRWTISTQT